MPRAASLQPLREKVTEAMARLHPPGVAVGVLHKRTAGGDGRCLTS